MKGSAIFDPTGRYRYLLTREWDGDLVTQYTGAVAFCGLNPSKASATRSDPTCTREINFAISWGYGRYEKVNLFGEVSTDPFAMSTGDDAAGPENDRYILEAASRATEFVCCWGNTKLSVLPARVGHVLDMLKAAGFANKLVCLGRCQDGRPRHPLYLRADTRREPFVLGAAA